MKKYALIHDMLRLPTEVLQINEYFLVIIPSV